mgnify:CR=1 FL=1
MGRTKLESKLKNRILDLIESPELHAYLMEHAERLKLKDYVSIIAERQSVWGESRSCYMI